MSAAAALRLAMEARRWLLREPFAISRGVDVDAPTLQVTLADAQGRRGRGEACGVPYADETPQTMAAQVEAVRPQLEAGIDRAALLQLLPAGGARCAVDAALWDLEAKQGLGDPFTRCGVRQEPVVSARTIGIRSLDGYVHAARAFAGWRVLKVKVDADNPLDVIEAVHRAAPRARLIVDPNQAWSVDQLKALAPRLAGLRVALLEQPIPVGAEAALDGFDTPIPLCADELVNDATDLSRAAGRFAAVNIKLDKTGGLTAGLALADQAAAMGFSLMVGCMGGSSLAMAPAMVLAQRCHYADLDGPLLQTEDEVPGFEYREGLVARPSLSALWG